MKFNYLGILQSLKLRILVEKILSISFKLNFTPNTLGYYGLKDDFVGRLRQISLRNIETTNNQKRPLYLEAL